MVCRAVCIVRVLILVQVVLLTGACIDLGPGMGSNTEQNMRDDMELKPGGRIMLPAPETTGKISVEEALFTRRSVRTYTKEPVTPDDLSRLLWAAQGVTAGAGGRNELRTAPSAGALYPLEVYVVAGNVGGVSDGVYHYRSREHALQKVCDGDRRRNLSGCALHQSQITDAAVDIVFTAVFERTTARYGDRGVRYVYMEAGHAAQNVYLQAETLDLGVCAVGAFCDADVATLLALPDDEVPIYILSIGSV
ncbi:MAG: SagB/ThcOx family dehydrogenase [Methanosarcinales archaeon]|nr:MAG: SagB/ThcOx family dehydrogenase [Methanosarcinales archaeon]